MTELAWYRDGHARALILFRYLPWLAALNLAWEAAHVRLYTIWTEAAPAYIAFSVLHCTLGDILIGGAALLLALVFGRERALARWHWPRIALLTVVFGASYTIFSEWMNITILRSWVYSDAMPTVALGSFRLGLTPLAQWLVVPTLALYLAQRTVGRRNRNEQAPA
jgi:hypothetical protein